MLLKSQAAEPIQRSAPTTRHLSQRHRTSLSLLTPSSTKYRTEFASEATSHSASDSIKSLERLQKLIEVAGSSPASITLHAGSGQPGNINR